jgi:hypothetical protein
MYTLQRGTHLWTLKHITSCTCLHHALWENNQKNLIWIIYNNQIVNRIWANTYILVHNLWTLTSDPHILKNSFDVTFT